MVVIGLYVLFEALSVIFCLYYLYGEKPRFDVKTIALIILEIIWMQIVYWTDLGQIWSLMMYPFVMAYCILEFGFDAKIILVNNILYIVIIGILQATIMLFLSLLFKTGQMEALDNLFINFVMFGIIIIVLSKCRLKRLSDVLQSNEKIVMLSFAVVVISVMLFLINYKQNESFEVFYYAVLGVSVVLIIVAAVDIGKHKIKAKEAEAELRLHKLYEGSFQSLIEDIQARQHEFNNHINTIYSMHFNYKTYDELVAAQRKYCGEVENESKYSRLLSKGNRVICCFLIGKISEMEKNEIRITYQVNIGEMESRVPIHKIVVLLGNLLNNAAEAVQKNDGMGKINLMMLEEHDKIVIEVRNESEVIDKSCMHKFLKKGYSEKGKNRGYGLYNVKKICEEYNLYIACNNVKINDRNWFTFKIIIKKPL